MHSTGTCPATGKMQFSKKHAQGAVNFRQGKRINRERGKSADKLRIYHCPHCNYWHLTKQRLRRDEYAE